MAFESDHRQQLNVSTTSDLFTKKKVTTRTDLFLGPFGGSLSFLIVPENYSIHPLQTGFCKFLRHIIFQKVLSTSHETHSAVKRQNAVLCKRMRNATD